MFIVLPGSRTAHEVPVAVLVWASGANWREVQEALPNQP